MNQIEGAIPGSHATHEAPTGLHPSGFDPERVLFLDIDGVVLSGEELYANGNNYLPPHKLDLVKEVCERTGAKVVVSSTWRYHDITLDRLRAYGLPIHENWRTPRAERAGTLYLASTRGTEIHRWLARNPVAAYAIVDDDSDMLAEQLPRFVKTPFHTGIDRDHVERLVAILTSDSDTRPKAGDAVQHAAPLASSAGRRHRPHSLSVAHLNTQG